MKTTSILTKYQNYCAFCGKPSNQEHHLVFGQGVRQLAEEDGIKLHVCDSCHTLGDLTKRIHDNVMAEKLSKMCGQLAYEKQKCAEGFTTDEARQMFRKRYGTSYL
jgi:hypothetical protein